MIDLTIFYDNGNLNKNKLRENWVSNNYSSLYNDLINFRNNSNLSDIKFSNLIYLYHTNQNTIPKCEWCNENPKRFLGLTKGYDPFCSKKCASEKSRPDAETKRRENTLKKWGVDHTSKLNSVKNKQKETNLKKWGGISPTNNNEVRSKQKNTMFEKYGAEYSGLSSELLNKTLSTRRNQYEIEVKNRFPDLNIEVIKEGLLSIKCDTCNNDYEIRTPLLRLRYFRYGVSPCLICNPLQSYGKSNENEIINLLDEWNINYIRNDRKILNGKELDIYIPSHKIAIEFNGLWWHSELHKDKKYHLDKKIKCENQNINLIHIWEDDWNSKKDIVISRLKTLLGLYDRKIGARKCIVKEIDAKTSFSFLEENHLQGGINSSIKYGLFYNNELVSVMTFGKLRKGLGQKNTDNKWELYRFCSLKNTLVNGSFSKMLSYFEKNVNPKELLTYANRDWSDRDNVYEKNGFEFQNYTDINYWYFKDIYKRYHRFQFRKDVLVKSGKDINKTEKEIMYDDGWNIIWDCGNLKFLKKY